MAITKQQPTGTVVSPNESEEDMFNRMQTSDDLRRNEQVSSLEEFYQSQMSDVDRINETRHAANMQTIENQAREAEKAGRYERAASGNIGGSKEMVDKGKLESAITQEVGQEQLASQQRLDADRNMVRANFAQELSTAYQRNPYYAEAMNAVMQGFDIRSTASQQRFQTQQQMDQAKALYGQRLGQIIGGAITMGGQTYSNYLEYGDGKKATPKKIPPKKPIKENK